MAKRFLSLPLGHNYIVLKNGAAAQLTLVDEDVLRMAIDHMIEHLNDVRHESKQGSQKELWELELESAEFLKELLG
ncbi:MAG: hypothetical protein ACPHL3_04850 [Paracoccaceae bacterium]